MRITSQTFYRNTLASIEQQRATVSRLTQELASSKKVAQPADDPVAFASAQRRQADSQALGQYRSDNANLSNQLGLGSSTLNQTLSLLDNVRGIALQALNATTSSANRTALAKQVAAAKAQLLGLANTKSNGRYLFAGTRGASQPFTEVAGGQVVYRGDGGGGPSQVSTNTQVASVLSGSVFADVPQGNGYAFATAGSGNTGTGNAVLTGIADQSQAADFRHGSSPYTIQITSSATSASGLAYTVQRGGATVSSGDFTQGMSLQLSGMNLRLDGTPANGDQFTVDPSRQQSLFATIDSLSQALEQSLGDGAQRAQANQQINGVLANLDQGRTRVLSEQATIGVSLRAINQTNNGIASAQSNNKQAISAATDADIPKVIIALNQHQNALAAAMKAFGSVSQLSLFKYL